MNNKFQLLRKGDLEKVVGGVSLPLQLTYHGVAVAGRQAGMFDAAVSQAVQDPSTRAATFALVIEFNNINLANHTGYLITGPALR